MIFELQIAEQCELFLQSVSARVGPRRGGRRRQGDGGRRLHGIIHGQDQAGAPDSNFVFRQGQLVIQTLIGRAAPGTRGGGALAVDGVRPRGVGADGDVGVHGAHAGVV